MLIPPSKSQVRVSHDSDWIKIPRLDFNSGDIKFVLNEGQGKRGKTRINLIGDVEFGRCIASFVSLALP